MPWRATRYALRHRAHIAELSADLAAEPARVRERVLAPAPGRAVALFVACAERSGETHAVSLVRALRAEARELGLAPLVIRGFGGARLADEGVELVARPVERAVMGLSGVLGSLPYYLGLLERCATEFRAAPPDVFVPVDSPALHVPLARIARRYGVPTVHFVAPQYWGWAPWRTPAYADAIERALTILPFEPAWFARRGVRAVHVGHPLLDHLAGVPVTRPAEGARELVLLPGSRASVIERNLPWMLALVRSAYAELGQPPLAILHDDETQRARLERLAREHGAGLALRVSIGALHTDLAHARAALSVSGTVLSDLLQHRLPTVVIYRLGGRREAWLGRHFLTAPWFASTNLLAGRELVPEFAFAGAGEPERVRAALVRCLCDERWRAECVAGLERAAERLGPAGASRRAAREVLDVALHGSPAAQERPS